MEVLAVDVAVLKCLDYWPAMYEGGIIMRVVQKLGTDDADVRASLNNLVAIGWLSRIDKNGQLWYSRTGNIPLEVQAITRW